MHNAPLCVQAVSLKTLDHADEVSHHEVVGVSHSSGGSSIGAAIAFKGLGSASGLQALGQGSPQQLWMDGMSLHQCSSMVAQ